MAQKKKKQNNSSANGLEILKWELRKRGIRPTGTQENMAKRLEVLKEEEEKLRNSMNNNKKKGNGNGEGPSTTTGPVQRKNSNGGGEKPVRHHSGSVSDVEERLKLVIWRRPFTTSYYFIREVPCAVGDAWNRFMCSLYDPRKKSQSLSLSKRAMLLLIFFGTLYATHFMVFKEDAESVKLKNLAYWYGYWVFLGILSSVGLGTGLHTFVLYLGPFIAKVTLAAQECGTLNFPEPPYPDEVRCPDDGSTPGVTVLEIMKKIRWESLMWGFGTALGELPPYFMAKAARISGMNDDEDLEKFNELLMRKKRTDPNKMGILERTKVRMEDMVEKVGFWGILACASIPNPLFDLAGITCGHFLVPFTTFFGATVIGKAIVKAHLQMTFVILTFNEDLLEKVTVFIRAIPMYGSVFVEPFVGLINRQKASLHNRPAEGLNSEGGLVAFLLEKIVMVMVIYFVISIVNSMAQSYHKRISKSAKAKS